MSVIFSRLSYVLSDFKSYLFLLIAVFLVGLALLLLKRNKLILLLVALGYTLVTLFAIGEFYFRYVFDQTDNVYQLKTTQNWVRRHVTWNSDGFRGPHFSVDKNPSETKIFFLGDSYTFGHGIKQVEDRYSQVLVN